MVCLRNITEPLKKPVVPCPAHTSRRYRHFRHAMTNKKRNNNYSFFTFAVAMLKLK